MSAARADTSNHSPDQASRTFGPGQPAPRDPAILQVTEQTRTYPCPNCGADLSFDPGSQSLTCCSCGTEIAIDPSAARTDQISKKELATVMTELSRLQANPTTQFSGDKEIICQSCGGHTIFQGTLTALRCPYCNTAIQRNDVHQSPARLPIDGLLPLRVAKDEARSNVESWINSRWFAPGAFKKYRTLGIFTSIYLPYFSYDSETTTSYRGAMGITRIETYTDSDGNQQTSTTTDWYPRSGVVSNQFEDVTGHAAQGLDDQKLAELEPWPMELTHHYSPEFVAGHLSRTYDFDPGEVFLNRARPRMEEFIISTIRSDIGGDQQRIYHYDVDWLSVRFCQLLLPVWMLTVTYKEKPFQLFINGVTGEVHGRRPWSAPKICLAVLGVLCALVLIYWISTSGSAN